MAHLNPKGSKKRANEHQGSKDLHPAKRQKLGKDQKDRFPVTQAKRNGGVPWLCQKPTSLHQEILMFAKFLEPSPTEKMTRNNLFSKLKHLIETKWPGSTLQLFGSCSTELCLPSSDMDCVILDIEMHYPRTLYQVKRFLASRGVADERDFVVIDKAKVPIVKFTTYDGINVDISFEQTGGLDNIPIVKNYLKEYPQLKPLLLVIKYFLHQRKLNDPASGGLGSYSTILIIISFLQTWKSHIGHMDDLGVLLIEFFRLYGFDFNYYSTGIDISTGGYFNKSEQGSHRFPYPFLLSITDPQDPENDVARASRHTPSIRQAFAAAFSALVYSDNRFPTVLSRIFFPDPAFEVRLEHKGPESMESFQDYETMFAKTVGPIVISDDEEDDTLTKIVTHSLSKKDQKDKKEKKQKKKEKKDKKKKKIEAPTPMEVVFSQEEFQVDHKSEDFYNDFLMFDEESESDHPVPEESIRYWDSAPKKEEIKHKGEKESESAPEDQLFSDTHKKKIEPRRKSLDKGSATLGETTQEPTKDRAQARKERGIRRKELLKMRRREEERKRKAEEKKARDSSKATISEAPSTPEPTPVFSWTPSQYKQSKPIESVKENPTENPPTVNPPLPVAEPIRVGPKQNQLWKRALNREKKIARDSKHQLQCMPGGKKNPKF